MKIDDIKSFAAGGMNQDDSPESIAKNDYVNAINLRNTGTGGLDANNSTNIESNTLLAGMLLAGLNDCNGGGAFEDIRQAAIFRTNSAGNNQILLYDYDSNSYIPIYTDVTDSAGQTLLPLNPANWVNAILVNGTYLIWTASNLEVGYTNLQKLASGAYGTVLAEDLTLLKPQCLIPPTGVYLSDTGKASNFLKDKIYQFNTQWINAEFNYSAWSTQSKRIIPAEESTPAVGTDSTANNGIIVSIYVGSIRVTTINIGAHFGDGLFSIVKTVQRAVVVALPNTSVDITTGIYEAYDPGTGLYSFVFYNEDVAIPVPATETDLFYDYIWPSNSSEKVNGNIISLGDFFVGYPRPTTPVTVAAAGYDPNINVPTNANPDPLTRGTMTRTVKGGFVPFKSVMTIAFSGTPKTGDVLTIILIDSRNASNTQQYTYTVPFAEDGDLNAVIASFAPTITGGSYSGSTITIIQDIYFSVQSATVTLFNAGPTVSRSIHSILDNSSYQTAREYRDAYGRPFPLDTTNADIVRTPSYAQVNGQAVEINWQINNPVAPVGAVDYQWLITPNNTVNNLLDVLATPLNYISAWNAHTNAPSLAPNIGTVGDTYQITTPNLPTDAPINLGNGAQQYNTGDYVVYNGHSWDIVQGNFGDLTSSGNILAFKIDPLRLFNERYSNSGNNTILSYSFTPGDRCTLHYYIDGANTIYINNPCVDLDVFGYDSGSYLVKVEKSATFDETLIAGKDVFIRLYSPRPAVTSLAQTVWYEIGERFTITNGLHDTLSGTITDGDIYYKTRQYLGAVDPNTAYEVLATDFNFSDFYASAFWSNGRPRGYYTELEQTERKANIITSQSYILGSRVNGLNRFYPENIYGDGDGQCSSSQGAIQFLKQRGDVLVVGQESNIFYIPVNIAYQVLNTQLTGIAISEKLLNNGRYETRGIGIGKCKESICWRYDVGYFISPFDSQPMEITLAGVQPISGKMSKYFKNAIQAAYAMGKRLHMYYDTYYEEVVLCIQSQGAIIRLFPFDTNDWNPNDSYVLVPGDITANNGSNSTVSYNSTTGIATYTPTTDYVGNDVATFSFDPGTGTVTKNVCLNWTAGSGSVNPFAFTPLFGVPISTVEISNTIGVAGNDYPVAISITGDPGFGYSINGAAFTAAAGTVKAGDSVRVRVTSSASHTTLTSCTLTIDGQTGTFEVTTATAGNFRAEANYGGTITSVTIGTGTGVPAGYNPCNLAPGMAKAAVYTTLTTGTYHVLMTGTPALPGSTFIFMSVNGVDVGSQQLFTGPGTYTFTLAVAANDPDAALFGVRT